MKTTKYTVKGKKYKTLKDVAKAEGINTTASAAYRFVSSSFPEYIMEGKTKIQCKNYRSHPITIHGKKYRTYEEAGKEYGVTKEMIRLRLADPKHPEYKSPKYPKKGPKFPDNKFTVYGKVYNTYREAAEEIGVCLATIRYRLTSDNFPDYVSERFVNK